MNISRKAFIYSIIVMFLWGSLYVAVKIGYGFFNIEKSNIPSIILFAGIRFFACGIIICSFSMIKAKRIKRVSLNQMFSFFIIGIFAIMFHYGLNYVGLSITSSSKTALLKQLVILVFIPLSFLFFKDEQFQFRKIIGALLGFVGIIILNCNKSKICFEIGDALIVTASFCTVVSNIISKHTLKNSDSVDVAGYSQLIGGLLLIAIGGAFGGKITLWSYKGVLILLYIIIASSVSYCIWYYVVGKYELSKLFIVKFTEPIFAGVIGAILLKEDIFQMKWAIAFVLTFTAIIISNCRLKYTSALKPFEHKIHDRNCKD